MEENNVLIITYSFSEFYLP